MGNKMGKSNINLVVRKNSVVSKKTPPIILFLLRKNYVKKLKNQELEFAEGFRRIKNIKENNFKILHKELKKNPEKLSTLKQNLTSSIIYLLKAVCEGVRGVRFS